MPYKDPIKRREYGRMNMLRWRHRTGKAKPMSEAKDSAQYLGIFIAERALSKFFDNIERMPNNNPGFDFLCGKGFKIDAKSSCLTCGNKNVTPYWLFTPRENQIADYFLCLGFNNREDLKPMRVWLIPGKVVNYHHSFSISTLPESITKWSKYEQPLDRVISCCNRIKEE